ncbi:hypothetical protein [Halomonas elongata]|uniref:hypothetical protein n=1 Tax=Halomonas elongata TaxID=2746 RepID=UPI00186BAC7E|nr:hypothetical protein [Halomonas elongata]MBW5800090.1 hypothetical protein [Halomonas elongata]
MLAVLANRRQQLRFFCSPLACLPLQLTGFTLGTHQRPMQIAEFLFDFPLVQLVQWLI